MEYVEKNSVHTYNKTKNLKIISCFTKIKKIIYKRL